MAQKEYPVNEFQKSYEDSRESTSSKDFMIGALVGGMIGAATALFMAPKTGKELRNDLNVQAKTLSEKTEKLRQTAMEKGSAIAGTAKEKTGTVTELVTNKSSDLMNKVKSMKSNNDENLLDSAGTTGVDVIDETGTAPDSEVVAVETSYENDKDNETKADPTSGNKNTAKLKLDETKKAFDETENNLKK